MFLEHVFWVVSLNSLFILIFAFCPYHIGHFTLSGFTVKHIVNGINFEVRELNLSSLPIFNLIPVLEKKSRHLFVIHFSTGIC